MHRRARVAVLLLVAALALSHVPAFAGPAAAAPDPGVIPGRYIVRFKRGVVASGRARELARVHRLLLRHVYSASFNGFAAEIPDALLPLLRADPSVLSIEPDRWVYAAEQTTPTGIRRVEAAPAAKNATARIDGVDEAVDVDIAIIDSGIAAHPDLNLAGGIGCVTPAGGGRDPTYYHDDYGHGTHVAGTAGARDNGIGVVGVAPGARLWAVKVLRADGLGSWSDVICGLDWVTANAGLIEVANLSLSGTVDLSSNDFQPCGGSPSLTSARHDAVCRVVNAGVTLVAAAGNFDAANGEDPNANRTIPGAYPEVIGVSALRDLNGAPGGDSFAGFSKRGSVVDIAAPGVGILSTVPGSTMYDTSNGTSMAAPHVAGAVGLCRATGACAGPGGARAWLFAQAEENDLGDAQHPEPILNVNDGFAWGVNAPPAVSLEDPGADLRGEITLAATATDRDGTVTGVEFQRSAAGAGSWSTLGTVAAPPYRLALDTTGLADGAYDLRAVATDDAGATARATVAGRRIDNTAPSVALTAPAAGAILAATPVQLRADAADASGTAAVRFEAAPAAGGPWTEVGADGAAPFAAAWTAADGDHALRAVARDAAGNQTTSPVRSVLVDTRPPSAPALTAGATGPDRVDLEWTAAADAGSGLAGYDVVRDTTVIASLPAAATGHQDATVAPGADHVYRVRARDNAGHVAASNPAPVTTPLPPDTTPTAPTALRAAVVKPSRVKIAWTAAADERGVVAYRVLRDGVPLPPLVAGGTTAFVDSEVVHGATYEYTVEARDAAGNVSAPSGALAVPVPFPPDTTPPRPPSGVSALASSPSTIEIAWQPARDDRGVTAYVVYRNGNRIAAVGAVTAFQDVGLKPGVEYRYRVVAKDAAGNRSAMSAPAAVATTPLPDETPPTAPTLAGSAASSTAIELDWTPAADAGGGLRYDVYRDGTLLSSVTQTAYRDAGLTPLSHYAYRVVARDAAGNETGSNEIAVATPAPPPAAPSGLTVAVVRVRADGRAVLKLTWTDNAGDETGYRVERRVAGGPWKVVARLPADAAVHRDTARSGLTIEYRVVAVNAGGASAASTAAIQGQQTRRAG